MSYIGFTGSRKGMTPAQQKAFREIIGLWTAISNHAGNVFIHGGCIGADEDAHEIVREASIANGKGFIYTLIRPSTLKDFWGKTLKKEKDPRPWLQANFLAIVKPKPPLERNRDIVNQAERMIACPDSFAEKHRSGTWSTIRYAKRMQVPVLIIWPDGMVTSSMEYSGSSPVDIFFRKYIVASNNEN